MIVSNLNSYDGNTVIITSDRLIFNSKLDSIIVSSKKTIGISAVDQVHINVGPLSGGDPKNNYFIINSPKIQMGIPGSIPKVSSEPVAKANALTQYISEMSNAMYNFASTIENATALGSGVSKLPEMSIAAKTFKESVKKINNKYGVSTSPIKSKITYTL